MKPCASCPYPGKCKAAGKCLKAGKDNKTMGSKKGGYGK
jgi:hypothetical protein